MPREICRAIPHASLLTDAERPELAAAARRTALFALAGGPAEYELVGATSGAAGVSPVQSTPDLATADSFNQFMSDAGFQSIDPLTHRVIRLQHGDTRQASGGRQSPDQPHCRRQPPHPQPTPRDAPAAAGTNRRVTGTFAHAAGLVYDLQVAGESEPLGVTALHPVWSLDRNDWVTARELEIGETVKTLTGTSTVESLTPREGVEPVFNIEVEGDHVYRVGRCGVLVHNASDPPPDVDYGCEKKSGHGRLNPCTSGTLNTSLGQCQTDYQAHHLIACSVRSRPALQRAAQLGFDVNGALNGWCLPSDVDEARTTGLPLHRGRHVSGRGTNPNYFTCVSSMLDVLDREYASGVANDCNLCSKVATVMSKIRSALASHHVWLQHNDPNKGPTWTCPTYP